MASRLHASLGWTVLAAAVVVGAADMPLGLDSFMPVPADNRLTPEKIALGRELFFDKRLSRDNTISCATCHEPELGFTDKLTVAEGVDGQLGTRRTPRLVNRGYGRSLFWDGRAVSLEEQVLKPIENPIEMALPLDELMRRLSSDGKYPKLFATAFGRGPSPETVAYALASYTRSIVSGNSPYDRYVAGETDALGEAQRRGLELFRGKAACTVCHLGPNLTDEEFHNTGVGWKDGTTDDVGREEVTGDDAERGAFKTPTLREVARSGPYMHNGSLATLEDVVEFYDEGGEPNPYLDIDMQPLGLSKRERRDLTEFLEALTGEIREGVQ